MNRQECKETLFNSQISLYFWTKLYSEIFYAFAKVQNMEPYELKRNFTFLIDPMYENFALTNKRCETLTMYLIDNMILSQLNEIAHIIHLDNLSSDEDENQ